MRFGLPEPPAVRIATPRTSPDALPEKTRDREVCEVTTTNEIDAETIAEQRTVAEVVRTAIRFEAAAEAFYARLLDRVRPEVQPLVAELVQEEREHGQRLHHLLDSGELVAELRARMRAPASMPAFEAMLEPPQLPSDPSDDDIFDYAMAREQTAAEHYAALARAAINPFLRETFAFLADEEADHIAKLGQRWGRLSGS